MPTPWIVEAINVFKQGCFRLRSGLPYAAPDQLGLKGFEESLDDSIEAPISVKRSRAPFLAHKYVDIFHVRCSVSGIE